MYIKTKCKLQTEAKNYSECFKLHGYFRRILNSLSLFLPFQFSVILDLTHSMSCSPRSSSLSLPFRCIPYCPKSRLTSAWFQHDDLSDPMKVKANPSKHRQELTGRLDALRRNETFCDVTVAVKGTELKAHKVLLAAASPFFLSLPESNMRESNEQVIRIELQEATAPVMEDVLKYIYIGNVSVTEESGHNLITTADYLLLPGLKAMACNFLKDNVTIKNCIFN